MEPGRGGISRVARMTAKAIGGAGAKTRSISLLDKDTHSTGGVRSKTAQGNKVKYAALCHMAAMQCDRFLYDAVGVARAHPQLPGLQKPYGVWMHGVEVWDSLHEDRERALRNADFVFVNSAFTLRRFGELHGPLDNAHIVSLATEDDEDPGQALFVGPPTALLVGRVDKNNMRKGHVEVVASWPAVVDAVPDARLVLAGGGDGLDLLKNIVAESPASASIDVLGFVPEARMPDLWRRAHVLVQPSWKEGFGIAYIEAMRHGLPVIASIHDAGSEVNLDGETGYNVDLNHPDELATKLTQLLKDTDHAKALGTGGHDRWKTHYRFSAFRDRLFGVLDACA